MGALSELTIDELRQIPLLSPLGPEELEPICARARRLSFTIGDEILREGESNDRLHCICSGRLRVWRRGRPSEVILAEVGAGSVLGELTFLEPGAASATATALEDGETIVLSSGDFALLEKEHPRVALTLYKQLTATLKERLAEATALILAQQGIQQAMSEVEELRASLGQLV